MARGIQRKHDERREQKKKRTHVISLETCSGWYSHGEVGEYRKESIRCDAPGAEVVGQFVHREGHHVIDRAGEGVAAEQPRVPRRSLQQVEGHELKRDPERHLELRGGIYAHEFL